MHYFNEGRDVTASRNSVFLEAALFFFRKTRSLSQAVAVYTAFCIFFAADVAGNEIVVRGLGWFGWTSYVQLFFCMMGVIVFLLSKGAYPRCTAEEFGAAGGDISGLSVDCREACPHSHFCTLSA